jgi:hypothetical protein
MPRGEWTSDSSSDSEGSEKDPFADPPTSDFIIPSPETLSDVEEDVSPSQYRKKWQVKNPVDNQMMKRERRRMMVKRRKWRKTRTLGGGSS